MNVISPLVNRGGEIVLTCYHTGYVLQSAAGVPYSGVVANEKRGDDVQREGDEIKPVDCSMRGRNLNLTV